MTKQKQSSSGQASKKPTQNEVNKKREALKARLRSEAAQKSGISNVVDLVEERREAKKIVQKTIKKKEATKGDSRAVPRLKKYDFKSAADIPKRNHAFRVKRMGKVFGIDRVNALRKEYKTESEFAWALYEAEQNQELTIKEPKGRDANSHLYTGMNGGGSSPVKFEWFGNEYVVDGQSKVNAELLTKILHHLAGNGSVTSFCARNKIPRRTFDSWAQKYECVKDAISWGRGTTLETYEKVAHCMATGMEVKELNEKFVKMPSSKILQGLLKNKFREEYHEQFEADNTDLKDIASLQGEDLAKKVTEIRNRQSRLDSENPFGNVNLYKGE